MGHRVCKPESLVLLLWYSAVFQYLAVSRNRNRLRSCQQVTQSTQSQIPHFADKHALFSRHEKRRTQYHFNNEGDIPLLIKERHLSPSCGLDSSHCSKAATQVNRRGQALAQQRWRLLSCLVRVKNHHGLGCVVFVR